VPPSVSLDFTVCARHEAAEPQSRWTTEALMRLTAIALTLLMVVTVAYGAHAVAGGPSAEQALQRFDQSLIDAFAASLPPKVRQSRG